MITKKRSQTALATYFPVPSLAEPIRKPRNVDPDDFSDDEQYHRHRHKLLVYRGWRYSLLCANNVIQYPNAEHQHSESPSKVSRLGKTSVDLYKVDRSPANLIIRKSINNGKPIAPVREDVSPKGGRAYGELGRQMNSNSVLRRHYQAAKQPQYSHVINGEEDAPIDEGGAGYPLRNQNPQKRGRRPPRVGLTQINFGEVNFQDNSPSVHAGHQVGSSLMLRNDLDSDRELDEGSVGENSYSGPRGSKRKRGRKEYAKMVYDPKIIAHMAKLCGKE